VTAGAIARIARVTAQVVVMAMVEVVRIMAEAAVMVMIRADRVTDAVARATAKVDRVTDAVARTMVRVAGVMAVDAARVKGKVRDNPISTVTDTATAVVAIWDTASRVSASSAPFMALPRVPHS